jgi:hypothetical protein
MSKQKAKHPKHHTVILTNCARCGKTHAELTFRELARPCEEWTHWAPCPHTHEPILMALTP